MLALRLDVLPIVAVWGSVWALALGAGCAMAGCVGCMGMGMPMGIDMPMGCIPCIGSIAMGCIPMGCIPIICCPIGITPMGWGKEPGIGIGIVPCIAAVAFKVRNVVIPCPPVSETETIEGQDAPL